MIGYDDYYNTSWQLLEARKTPSGGSTTTYQQYVWRTDYIDAPVLMDRDADGTGG